MYNNYGSSIGNNFKHVQITTKYRYDMMRKEKIEVFCKVAICYNKLLRRLKLFKK
jgi:hypothetical protein